MIACNVIFATIHIVLLPLMLGGDTTIDMLWIVLTVYWTIHSIMQVSRKKKWRFQIRLIERRQTVLAIQVAKAIEEYDSKITQELSRPIYTN